MPSMNAGEYGWLSIRSRRSTFTVPRWCWKFSSVLASDLMRSAVGQRERFVRDLAGLAEQRGSERGAEEQQSSDDGRDAQTTSHGGVGTTGPDRTSSNENVPSSVWPFTTRRGPVRVAKIRKPPLRNGRTSNRPAGTSIEVGDSATKLSVTSESSNSLYAGTASESPGTAFDTAP